MKVNKSIFLYDGSQGYSRVLLSDILYLQANGPYTKVIISDPNAERILSGFEFRNRVQNRPRDNYTVSMNLAKFENILDERFLKVHRSYIINLNKVTNVWRSGELSLERLTADIPFSKTYRDVLFSKLHIIQNINRTD